MTWTGWTILPRPPFSGAIGSPPGAEATSSPVPDRCGGRMDLPDAGVGASTLKSIAEA